MTDLDIAWSIGTMSWESLKTKNSEFYNFKLYGKISSESFRKRLLYIIIPENLGKVFGLNNLDCSKLCQKFEKGEYIETLFDIMQPKIKLERSDDWREAYNLLFRHIITLLFHESDDEADPKILNDKIRSVIYLMENMIYNKVENCLRDEFKISLCRSLRQSVRNHI